MKEKILNVGLTIIVVLLLIIFCNVYYMVNQYTTSNSIYDDVATNSDQVEESNNAKLDTAKLNPFTGAFPEKAIIPFLVENTDITEFSNEQILELGFAKANKEDWADSYRGEGEPVSISAELLDNYIKDIFGENIVYTKTNFSNKQYGIDKTINSFFYDAVYVPESDSYIIDFMPGDGIGENHIELLEPTVSRINNTLEIEIPYLFVGYSEEMISKEIDGEKMQGFEYIAYLNCDYTLRELNEEIGRFSEFDSNDNNEFIYSEHIESIANKNLSRLNRCHLIYELNEDGTRYILKEFKIK